MFPSHIQHSVFKVLMLLLILPLLLTSCNDKQVQTITWTEFEPVYMSQEEFINSVGLEEPRELEKPGKIYFHNGFLFVNEVNEGIHIIDNRDPSTPVVIGFINIPANKDIAVKDGLLYADSQKDLLVFDISDLNSPELIDRMEDVFKTSAQRAPGFTTQSVDPSKGLVVDWKKIEREEICEDNCHSHPANQNIFFDTAFSGGRTYAESSGSGVGGSMARFAITGDYLYAVDFRDLFTFDISQPEAVKVDNQYVGWMIETIFPYEENLFIGSGNSMYIYDLSNPESPRQLSVFRHATACDPVVVEGDYAYVTLRDGELCPNNPGNNQLEVIDVSDLTNPKNIGIYKMINPQGLGIDNGNLFISEGDHGLKIMDAGNPHNIKQIRHITDIKTYDVIPYNGVLMITGRDGIVQYDYSDINDLKHLSTIPVQPSDEAS
ncbi:MAG: hypothetical protein GVY08_06615 [Bacteroidetes bacterium]|nr:hypothetical protein [Bacteroidota bacterium]